MCTVVVALGQSEAWPLLLAANRDELLSRPWEPPATRTDDTVLGTPWLVYPRDEKAAGTWLGLRQGGRVVTVTNRGRDNQPGKRSRGLLVSEALAAPTSRAAVDAAERALRSGELNPCNLLVVDPLDEPGHGWLLTHGPEGTVRRELMPGMAVVTSTHDLDPPLLASVTAPLRQAARLDFVSWAIAARQVLTDHRDFGRFYSVCKHHGPYGTANATILGVDATGRAEWLFAPGAPCVTAFAHVSLP